MPVRQGAAGLCGYRRGWARLVSPGAALPARSLASLRPKGLRRGYLPHNEAGRGDKPSTVCTADACVRGERAGRWAAYPGSTRCAPGVERRAMGARRGRRAGGGWWVVVGQMRPDPGEHATSRSQAQGRGRDPRARSSASPPVPPDHLGRLATMQAYRRLRCTKDGVGSRPSSASPLAWTWSGGARRTATNTPLRRPGSAEATALSQTGAALR